MNTGVIESEVWDLTGSDKPDITTNS